ncbi:LysR family transcriptional regulator [Halalkalibacter lacteus]|uniref:LysR family transcriptional regulator n=1 Tax=Halalkalibacter lacteus TaxID=3090663 RepID=UPI002FC93B29
MNFNQLEAFLALKKMGNFTKAAELLYIPQPTLSNRISQLEREVGETLFIRGKNSTSLTEAGQFFATFAIHTIESMKKTQRSLQDYKSNKKTNFHIGFPIVFYNDVIPNLIPNFVQKCPDVKFLFSQMNSNEIVSALKNNVIDLGITSNKVKNEKLSFIEIDEQEISIILSPSHKLAKKRSLSLEEIGTEPLITFKSGTLYHDSLTLILRELDIPYNIISEINDIKTIKELIKRNAGISLLPKGFVKNDLLMKKLISKSIEYSPFPKYKTYLAYRKEDSEKIPFLFTILIKLMEYFGSSQMRVIQRDFPKVAVSYK